MDNLDSIKKDYIENTYLKGKGHRKELIGKKFKHNERTYTITETFKTHFIAERNGIEPNNLRQKENTIQYYLKKGAEKSAAAIQKTIDRNVTQQLFNYNILKGKEIEESCKQ